MLEFLSYGFTSVMGGFLTSIALVFGIIFIGFRFSNNRFELSPLCLILSAILFCLLFYQTTCMYAYMSWKDDCVSFINSCLWQFGDNIDGEEFQSVMVSAINDNPLLAFIVNYVGLADFDWSQPITSLGEYISTQFDYMIIECIIWIIVFLALFGFLILRFSETKKRRKSFSYSSNDEYNTDYDF